MGNSTKNVIEINGKRYDAVTGALLRPSEPLAQRPAAARPPARSIDGFSRGGHKAAPAIPSEPLQPILKKIAQPVRTTMSDPANPAAPAVPAAKKPALHLPAKHAAAHTPQPSKTLMRSAVKKPQITSPAVIRAQTRTDILAKVPAQLIKPKLSHATVDPERLKRATRMLQSPAVSHYSHNSASIVTAPSQSAPSPAQPAAPARQPVASHASSTVTPLHRPGQTVDSFRRPAHSRGAITQPVATHPHSRPGHSTHHDMFEKAIASATSHEQTYTPPKKVRRAGQFAKFTTVTLTALLLIAFFGYQNLPNLNMRLASSKAGFSVKAPGYSPAGFTMGKLSYQPGSVNVSYVSEKTADKSFNISQKVSTWDSQALLNNFVVGATRNYQTYQGAGRTVYLYGTNTATWVDNGVWYLIDGNTSLTRDQLINVATSI